MTGPSSFEEELSLGLAAVSHSLVWHLDWPPLTLLISRKSLESVPIPQEVRTA